MTIFEILEKNRLDTGSVQQMVQAAGGLAARGHAVTVISRPGGDLEDAAGRFGFDFVPLRLRSEVDVASIAALRRLVRARKPEVIHVHKGLSHTLALAATWFDRVPAFIVNRGVTFPLTFWNSPKYRTSRVDRIVAVSAAVREVLVASGRIDPARVVVIPAGTDAARFAPELWPREEFRNELGVTSSDELVVQVGVRDWKGWRELVDAVAHLAARRPRLHLALIGCRSDAAATAVRAHAAARGAGGRVHVIGYRDDMPRVFAAADCVVDASWAGTGITGTIREAMAMARPVVATDCGGNRELVTSPDLGWIVPPRDSEALAAAIDAVLSDPRRATSVGVNARRRVVQEFSLERRIDRLETLYRDVIINRRR